MKKILPYLIVSIVLVLTLIEPVRATWSYTNASIPYTVSNNQTPIVNAGPDHAITNPPTSSVTATGTASDPDGSIVLVAWVWQSGPVTPTITTPNALSTTITGMTAPGTYQFSLSAQDDGGVWGTDYMQVVVSSGGPTPSGTISSTSCLISVSNASCSSLVTWTTANLTAAATAVTQTNPSGTVSSATSGTNVASSIDYGTSQFYLYHNGVLLDQSSANASCTGGTSWNGEKCEAVSGGSVWASLSANPTSITSGDSSTLTWDSNGTSCTGTNFSTGFGSASSGSVQVYPSVTTIYTVDCTDGSASDQDQATVTVSGAPGGGGPQCSDGIDNGDIEDTLADTLDPGCHSDGNAANPGTYDPNDDDESNKRKPIYIEF